MEILLTMSKQDILIEIERALQKSRDSNKRYIDTLNDLQNDLIDILIMEHQTEISRLKLSKADMWR